jgi:hypothetical protein
LELKALKQPDGSETVCQEELLFGPNSCDIDHAPFGNDSVVSANHSEAVRRAVLFWEFREAPKQLSAMSPKAVDGDWVAYIPPQLCNDSMPWLTRGTKFGICDVDEILLPDGGKALIGRNS